MHLHLHIQRMAFGMNVLKMKFPASYGESYFEEQIEKLLSRSGIQNARLKVVVYRDNGGLYTPETLTASYIITATPIEDTLYAINPNGLNLGIYTDIEKPINVLSTFKSNNSLIYVMAGLHAKEHGFDDCIITNTHQHLVESTNSNLFIINNGNFYTPSLQNGCVNGVMRAVVLQVLHENNQTVHEVDLLPEDLLQADEIFITNAARGVRWVSAFKDERYYKTRGRWVVSKLNEYLQIGV